jgi:hypothetical protein
MFPPIAGSVYLLEFSVVLRIIIIIIIIHVDIVFCFIVSHAFPCLPGGTVVVRLFVLLFCVCNPLQCGCLSYVVAVRGFGVDRKYAALDRRCFQHV